MRRKWRKEKWRKAWRNDLMTGRKASSNVSERNEKESNVTESNEKAMKKKPETISKYMSMKMKIIMKEENRRKSEEMTEETMK